MPDFHRGCDGKWLGLGIHRDSFEAAHDALCNFFASIVHAGIGFDGSLLNCGVFRDRRTTGLTFSESKTSFSYHGWHESLQLVRFTCATYLRRQPVRAGDSSLRIIQSRWVLLGIEVPTNTTSTFDHASQPFGYLQPFSTSA